MLQYLREQLDGELRAESNLIVRPHLLLFLSILSVRNTVIKN